MDSNIIFNAQKLNLQYLVYFRVLPMNFILYLIYETLVEA